MYTKLTQYLFLREFYSLPVPNVRWKTISIDFVIKLSKSIGFDIVMIVVDLIFKRTHFISIYMTIIVEGTIRLFLHNIWKLHNLSTHVILDRGPQFAACFTKEL